VALGLALACGLMGTAEARQKKHKKISYKAQKYKVPKYKKSKAKRPA
jgi:hypothetical protein